MSDVYACPVCDVRGTLQEVRPHVVHTSDEDHAPLESDDVVHVDADDPESSSSVDEEDDTKTESGSTPSSDPDSSSPGPENDDTKTQSSSEMNELERQREKLKSRTAGDDETTTSTTPDGGGEGESTTSATDNDDSTTSDVSATARPDTPFDVVPSFDSSTLMWGVMVVVALAILYVILTRREGESTTSATDNDEPTTAGADQDTAADDEPQLIET